VLVVKAVSVVKAVPLETAAGVTRRRWVSPLFLLSAAAVLAGCGAGASPANESATPLTVSTPTSAKPTLADFKPCDLLSPSDRSTAGLTTLGVDKTIGTARACDWTAPATFGVTVTLDDTTGLSGLKVEKKTATTKKVGAHPAMQVSDKKAADGTCSVLLGVGDSASAQVDVSNTTFSDTALACSRASTVAGLIEPKLP
jgi:hypothetical protein